MLHQFSVEFEGNDMKIQRLVLLCATFSLGFVVAADDSDRWADEISSYDSPVDSEQNFEADVNSGDQSSISSDVMSEVDYDTSNMSASVDGGSDMISRSEVEDAQGQGFDVESDNDNDSDGRWSEESPAFQAIQNDDSDAAMQREENEANYLGEQAADMMLGGDVDLGESSPEIDDQSYNMSSDEQSFGLPEQEDGKTDDIELTQESVE